MILKVYVIVSTKGIQAQIVRPRRIAIVEQTTIRIGYPINAMIIPTKNSLNT